MPLFKHVLVATDFSEPSQRAEELGTLFAERCGAKLTVLHVLSVPSAAFVAGGSLRMDQLERLASNTLNARTAALEERFPALTKLMRVGSPWEEILATAKEVGADLIVMGTHGRRGVPRALLGSVAERVVRMATIPVLTVAASEAPGGERAPSPR